ncbi:MAG: type II toxin-antitoxin system Phd/YefM family antitoxin [Myxococcaceae bacterium]
MTRFARKPSSRRRAVASYGRWALQDAKARFSELVRIVRKMGPQRVTVHGRDEIVLISIEEFRRLKGESTGSVLVKAMQASPHREVSLQPERERMPVREISFS